MGAGIAQHRALIVSFNSANNGVIEVSINGRWNSSKNKNCRHHLAADNGSEDQMAIENVERASA